MSLATRCAHCGTVFRLVQDQLKVSEGWVRCGRCNEVFNAIEGLFDLDREGPISGSMPLRAVETPPPAETPPTRGVSSDGTEAPAGEGQVEAADGTEVGAGPEERTALTDFDLAETQFLPRDEVGSEMPMPFASDTQGGDAPLPGSEEASDSELAEAAALLTPDAPGPAPRFLRQAQRAADWDRPRVRASLWLAAVLLGLTLAGQWAMQQRDTLALQWPAAAPALETACEWLGCTVEAPRRIEALAVENSGLTRVDGSALYRLQVTLRNRDALPVRMPALDVTLTDGASDTVVRRVLTAADFGAADGSRLAAGAEVPLAAVIDVGPRRIAGYTIELFYP